MATLKILAEFLHALFQEDFARRLRTQKAAGTLPQKRALLLYKVLGEVAALTGQLHTDHRHLLAAGRTGQLRPGLLATMTEVVASLDKQLRHLAAAVRAIHPAYGLKPQLVSDPFTQWVTGSVGAERFVTDLRWETARRPGSASTWRQAVSQRLHSLATELDANHRQIQDGIAAVRQVLLTEFTFSEEFFPR
ncbi:MAG TPA: hypothetical protein VGX03_38045 [Candidatus Binatia bacterium]|nr:hypothetical protein [Candidatus Binatia bacterium]